MHALIGTTRSSCASLTSSSDAFMPSFETPGGATASATLKVKGQKGGRRRPKMRPAFEETNDDETGTDPRRQPGSFNLIAKTSQAFLQALGDYQQQHGTAQAQPEALFDSPDAVAEEDINDDEDTEEEDGGDEDRNEDESDQMDFSAKADDCSLTLTALGARRAWGRLRLHITETAMKNNSKESILGWRFLRLAVSSLSNLEKTRKELYERYLEKPESWTDALVNCPDHLRFRNFKTCSATKVPRLSSRCTIGDKSPRWSPLSATSPETGRSSADHVTKTGRVSCRTLSGVVTKTVDARTGRDLPRTNSAFIRNPRIQSSTIRGESAKARFSF